MTKFDLRLRGQNLRREGNSLSHIAKNLGVSKSTVSLWSRNIVLGAKQLKVLHQNQAKARKQGQLLGAHANHLKKENTINFYIHNGRKSIRILSSGEFFIAGIALYWAEGGKSHKLSFVNSDPAMILFMYRWFQKCEQVSKKDFMPRIFINEIHKPRISKVIGYWSRLLDLPRKQFGNPTFLKMKQKKVYKNYDSYYGILAVRIRRSTKVRYKILGLIEGLKESAGVAQLVRAHHS